MRECFLTCMSHWIFFYFQLKSSSSSTSAINIDMPCKLRQLIANNVREFKKQTHAMLLCVLSTQKMRTFNWYCKYVSISKRSSFILAWWHLMTSCARGRHNMPRLCDLRLWPFDLESGVRLTCDAGYATDRSQTDVRRASSLKGKGGHNTRSSFIFVWWLTFHDNASMGKGVP